MDVGFNFVLYLAGLQEIPRELYEAAAVDGATPGQQLRRITLPLLSSTLVLVTTLQVIASLKIFDQIYLLQIGTPGPENSTRPAIQYIYETGLHEVPDRLRERDVVRVLPRRRGRRDRLVPADPARRHADGDLVMSALGARRPRSILVEGPHAHRAWVRPLLYAVLVAFALIWVVPLAWAVATSLKPDAETTIAPVSWRGSEATLDAYRVAIEQGNILQWYFNSLITATAITIGTIITASMAAFAFSRMRFRGRDLLSGWSWRG